MASDMVLGDALIRRIHNRLHGQNKNWLCVICGDTGSGKTYTSIRIAMTLNTTFDVGTHLVFTASEFMSLLNSGMLRKGDIIVFDEAGVGMSSRSWMTVQNKVLGSVLQTFRHLNLGVIFTVPNLSFIDVQARRLFHNYFETLYIDHERQNAYLKVYDIKHNSMMGKTFYIKPRFTDESGRTTSVEYLGVPNIPSLVSELYERRKQAYTRILNEKAEKSIRRAEQKEMTA